jgi:hypothetical protein
LGGVWRAGGGQGWGEATTVATKQGENPVITKT